MEWVSLGLGLREGRSPGSWSGQGRWWRAIPTGLRGGRTPVEGRGRRAAGGAGAAGHGAGQRDACWPAARGTAFPGPQ